MILNEGIRIWNTTGYEHKQNIVFIFIILRLVNKKMENLCRVLIKILWRFESFTSTPLCRNEWEISFWLSKKKKSVINIESIENLDSCSRSSTSNCCWFRFVFLIHCVLHHYQTLHIRHYHSNLFQCHPFLFVHIFDYHLFTKKIIIVQF